MNPTTQKPTQSNQQNTLSDFSQQINQLFTFIENRKQIRQSLSSHHNKNSLSKNNINTSDFPDVKNQLFTQLVTALAEAINEGHTILSVNNQLLTDDLLFTWQQQQKIMLVGENSELNTGGIYKSVEKPIVIQRLADRAVVWLYRQWYAERQLAEQLLTIAERPMPTLILDTPTTANIEPNAQQQLAIQKASQNALCIITGGPGTGKTFTVAQLVIALHTAHEAHKRTNPNLPPLSISLTAPTGKAAQRMQESLSKSLADSLQDEKISIDNAKTLHRLLGIGSSGVPRYDKHNPLPDDLIIVDEASMLGLELAGLLVDAIKPTARLILLGDANQLSAVDAGAVLADLCAVPALQPYRVALNESKRFDEHSAIGQLATALTVTEGKTYQANLKNVLALLPKQSLQPFENQTKNPDQAVQYSPILPDTDLRLVYDRLASLYQPFFDILKDYQQGKNVSDESQSFVIYSADVRAELFAVFDKFRVLSAGHHGHLGVKAINQMLTKLYKKQARLPLSDSPFFHGQPIMMLKNDYQLGLFNGDIGIFIQQMTRDSRGAVVLGEMVVCFPDKVVPISRISQDSCDTAYAFTIHKSQGSEFEHVAVCLDVTHTRLLSQELIYTAITRSKQKLSLFCPEMTLRSAVLQKGNRQTGLMLQFE